MAATLTTHKFGEETSRDEFDSSAEAWNTVQTTLMKSMLMAVLQGYDPSCEVDALDALGALNGEPGSIDVTNDGGEVMTITVA